MSEVKLGDISFITKLAGFEHTKYIQGNNTHEKISADDVPLFIGKTVQNGKIDKNFDWYIPKELSNQLERSKLNKKCLVLPYVGSVGDLAIFDASYDAHLGSNIAKIELAENCGYSEEFIYYFLKSDYGQKILLRDIQGAIQKNITMKAIREVSLPDISIQEQNNIVSILKALDDKIQINNQINQELEAMAKTLYDYWFVQFDFPDQNGNPYKSSGGKMVYNQDLKREIPERWGVEKLDSLLKIGKETTNPKKFPYEEFKYYSIPEFDTTGTYSLERGESIKSNKFKVEKNDLLVSKLNPWFNRVIYNLEENAISSTEFIVWKTFNRFEKNFLYQVATGKEFIEYCTRFATGTSNSHKRVSPDIMIGFQIPFEKTYIQKFGEIIDSIRTQVLQNNVQNQELTRLRDWLLPMLMNGQVKV